MVKVTVVAVGKIKEKYFTDAINEYKKRLSAYCNYNIIEVDDEATKEKAGDRELEEVKEKEGKRILSKLPTDAFVCALCIDGELLDSRELAKKTLLQPLMRYSHIVFVIGGSLGLSSEVVKKADLKISFGRVTYPHQLMRVILSEQIYRCFRINANEPYHK